MATSFPTGPLSIGKSGSIITPDRYERRLIDFCNSLDDEAKQEQEAHPEFSKIQDYVDMIEGRMWDRSRPSYRSKFVDNHMARIRKDARAQYTDIRPAIEILSNSTDHKDKAAMLTKAILAEWARHRFDLKLVSVIDHAMFGDGFWKIGAIQGTDDVPARLVLTPCGIDTVVPIKCSGELQDSSAVLYKCYKTINYFRRIFGDRANGLEKEAASLRAPYETYTAKPDGLSDYTWSSMSPAMRRWKRANTPQQLVQDSPFPMVQLREYWFEDDSINEYNETVIVKNPYLPLSAHNYWYEVKPGRRLYPRKRLIVRAGDRPMYDGPSPYWHPFYPFEGLQLDPNVWSPGGLSKYRYIAPLQKVVNTIGAGVSDMVVRAMNPTVVAKTNTITAADWDRFYPEIPGQKLRANQNANIASDIRYMETPKLEAYVMQFLQTYLIPGIDKSSGTLDVNALARKKQIPAMDSIESMKEIQGGHFRLEGGFIEAFLAKTGTQAVSNILQFFNVNDRMRLYGSDGIMKEDFDYDPKSMIPAGAQKDAFWRMFSVAIAPHSLHGSSEDRAKQVAITLRARKDISRKELFRRLQIQNGDQIEKELLAEHAQEAKLGAAQQHGSGRTPRLSSGSKKGAAV